MDRLICGDVGFGKTEVALRAAFVAAMAGSRWRWWRRRRCWRASTSASSPSASQGCRCASAQLSRLVAAKDAQARSRPASPTARSTSSSAPTRCSARASQFKNLGLVIVDEEQHFGVAHKERLKELRADVHVLTLTATPIPRTLQMALSGVREMSLIATPPVDRLAVRTFVIAVRPGGDARGDPARALPRRPELLRLPAHRGPAELEDVPGRAGARGQVRASPTARWRRPSSKTS